MKGQVGMTVLIGSGVEHVRQGMSGYMRFARHIELLTCEQVSSLMSAAIVRHHGLKTEHVDTFLRHPAVQGQIRMLMGLPGFMHMALEALYPLLHNFPSTDKEIRFALAPSRTATLLLVHSYGISPCIPLCSTLSIASQSCCVCRQVAGAMSQEVRSSLKHKLLYDMQQLGAHFVYRLLLLSLSGVKIRPR